MLKRFILYVLKAYKKFISPVLPSTCRFYPTCADYTTQAIKKHGIVTGLFLGVKRLVRCNPLNSGGYDPVP
ncbi:MAG: membrane protein insertion efficiency factor YidD [bacterium]